MTGTRVLGATFGTLASSLVAAGVAFAAAFIAARVLGPGGKGTFDLMMATATLVAQFGGLAAGLGVTYAVAKDPTIASRIAGPSAALAVLVLLGTGLLLFALRDPAQIIGLLPVGADVIAVVAIALLASSSVLLLTVRAGLIGQQRIWAANAIEIAGRLAGLAIGLALVLIVRSPVGLALGISVGLTAAAALQLQKLGLSGWLDVRAIEGIIRYSLPGYVSSSLQFLNYRLDLFLVAYFRNPIEVGIYALAGTLAQVIWLGGRATATVLLPHYAASNDRDRAVQQLARSSRIAVAVGIVGGAALGISSTLVVPMVFGQDFASAVPALWLLLPGVVAFSPVIVTSPYFLGIGRPGLNVIASAVGLLVTVIGDLAVIPSTGMFGAAAVSSIAYATSCAVTLVLLRRLVHLRARDALVLKWDDVSAFGSWLRRA